MLRFWQTYSMWDHGDPQKHVTRREENTVCYIHPRQVFPLNGEITQDPSTPKSCREALQADRSAP